ncbi:hypothetical protein BDR07DRAFT_1428408, partial [Suillus spraguei]
MEYSTLLYNFQLLSPGGAHLQVMPGLTLANKLVTRDSDEGMHTDFACLLFSHLKYHPHSVSSVT